MNKSTCKHTNWRLRVTFFIPNNIMSHENLIIFVIFVKFIALFKNEEISVSHIPSVGWSII